MSVEYEIRREDLRSSALVGTVAIAAYGERDGLRDRRHVLQARNRFTQLCGRLGFGRSAKLEGDGTRSDVVAGIRRFVEDDATRKILYWTGHGHATDAGYVLACRDSYTRGHPHPDPYRAMPFTTLLDELTKAKTSDVLLIIDACESQDSLSGSARLLEPLRESQAPKGSRDLPRRGFAVLATAGADRQMEESLWVDWLEEVLADQSLELHDRVRPFEPTSPFLHVEDLLEAIDLRASGAGFEDPEQRPSSVQSHPLSRRFLHNPYYDSTDAAYHSAVLPPDREPWLTPALFSPVIGGVPTHQFSGRVRPLSRLVTWIASQSRGMVVVTGPAGTGKTALLARLALLSVPRLTASLVPEPPPQSVPRPGSVHGAVSCHGASLHSLARSLMRALAPLGVDVPDHASATARDAVDLIGGAVPRVGGITLIVDGLDEAMPGQAHEIARRLLNPLSRCPGVKLIVGTRAHPRQATGGRTEESLLDALDRSSPDLALDRDREAEGDIAALVTSILAETSGSPYAGTDAAPLREETASRVSRRCGRRFLVAQLVARELARQSRPLAAEELDSFIRDGGGELHERMADELNALDPDGRGRCAELLLPLAVVQGPGLDDRELWLHLANELRQEPSPRMTREMLDAVIRRIDGVLVTSERRPGQRPLYRLDHASYGTALLKGCHWSEGAAHRRVFKALHRPSDDWGRADDYTLTYLGAHAARSPMAAEELEEEHPLERLFRDPGFLVATAPDVMLTLTGQLIATCDGAALYRRVGPWFRDHTLPERRRAILRAEAFVGHPEIHDELSRHPGFSSQPWLDVWTEAEPQPPELTLPAPLGGAIALSWDPTGSGTLSIAGRGEIVSRRTDTGAYVHTRRAHGDGTRTVFAEIRETAARRGRMTVSHDGRALHLWWRDERRPRRSYTWDGRISALDAARCGDGVQIVTADGRCVWAWRWAMVPAHTADAPDVHHDVLPVPAERVALLSLRDRCFLLTAADAVTLHELRVKLYGDRPLVQDSWPLPTEPGRRYAAAALPEGPESGLIAMAEGGTERAQVTVWRVTAGRRDAPHITRVLQLTSPAREIALGRKGELTLIALHEGHRVRIRSLDDDAVNTVLELTSQRSGLAFDPRGTGLLAVGDGDDVRVIDTAALPGTDPTQRPRGRYSRAGIAVAAGAPGAPVLLVREGDQRLLLSLHDPLRGQVGSDTVLEVGADVSAMSALWSVGGWTVAAAVGRRVRLWRLDGGLSGAAEDTPVELSGDAGDMTTSLALVSGPGGSPWLFVPDGRHVVPCTREDGRWTPRQRFHAAEVKVSEVAAHTASGRTWVVANEGDKLTLWEGGEAGFAFRDSRAAVPDRLTGIALTTRHDGEEDLPLLAWIEAGALHLAEYDEGRWLSRRCTPPHGTPTALAFVGPATRPLLLAFGGEETVAIRDVTGGEWIPELAIPYRGTDVYTACAVRSPRQGLTLFLQGRRGCDQVRIPRERLETALRRT
ncbi:MULTISPECIES: AAA family ATPase [unclassified Streptomyces]|uniref:AAA family ATPase n=1 Tax=unclassified Streptomyces TaxID=2593676 RepID=UPI0036E8C73A